MDYSPQSGQPPIIDETQNTTPTVPQVANVLPAEPQLISVSELLTRAWQNLKRNAGSLFLLGLLSIGVVFMFVIGLGVLFLTTLGVSIASMGDISHFDWQQYLLKMDPSQLILLAIIGLVLFIGLSIISAAISYGQILLVADTEKQGLWTYIRKGFGMIVPLLAVNFLVGIIVFGNMFLLVIPAIVAGVYLCVTTFEVLLNNKRGSSALVGSATIIGQHFSYLLTRGLVLFGLQMLAQIISYLLEQGGEPLSIILTVFNLVSGLFLGWFGATYSVELYKELRDKTDWNKPAKITWMWITSIVGFVLFILLAVGSFSILNKIQSDLSINGFNSTLELPKPIQEN